MTFTEMMLEKFPSSNLNKLIDGTCPCEFGVHTEMTDVVDGLSYCFESCKVCWDSEITRIDNNQDR
jgi:hypothetical protein